MDDDAFEAHLALHGLRRYDRSKRKKKVFTMITPTYVDDEQLVEIFRDPNFIRIDHYGPMAAKYVAERAIPGFEEFGAIGMCTLYTRKKNHG